MRGFGQYLIGGVVVFASAALPQVAHADGVGSPTGKGIVGGGLLGGETVMLVEAAADVKPAWAYAVGGGLGAVAGAVGGHFVETDAATKVSLYMLVGGMVLVIPTTVAVLSATAYEPVNYVEDRPPADEPVANPAQSAPPAPSAPTSRATTHHSETIAKLPKLPPALVAVDEGSVTMSVPDVEVRQMYTRTEIAELGIKQRTEVSIPLVNVVF